MAWFSLRSRMVALLLALGGFLNVVSAVWAQSLPRIQLLEEIVPLEVSNVSRTLTMLAGLFLLFLSRGIWRRKRRAWQFAIVTLLFSVVLHLVKGLDLEEVIILSIPLGFLWLTRNDYTVLSARPTLRGTFRQAVFILTVAIVYSFVGLALLHTQFGGQVTVGHTFDHFVSSNFGLTHDPLTPRTVRARWFDDSVTILNTVAFVALFIALFSPFVLRRRPSEADYADVQRLQRRYGTHPSSFLALLGDKEFFFNRDRTCAIAYKVRNGTAVVLGDPLGPADRRFECLEAFLEAQQRHGITVAILSASASLADWFRQRGYSVMKSSEDAQIVTHTFTLEGHGMKDVRNAVTRMRREGVRYEWYPMDRIPDQVSVSIDRLRTAWLDAKRLRGLTYSVDFYPFPPDADAGVFVASARAGSVLAVLSFFPYDDGRGMTLELMLRARASQNGTIEAAIAEAVMHFRQQGVEVVSIGGAPLANNVPIADLTRTSKLARQLFTRLEYLYATRTLIAFKRKFHPRWEAHFLVYQNVSALPRVVLALIQVHLSHSLWRTFVGLLQGNRPAG